MASFRALGHGTVNVPAVKAALEQMGVPVGPCRMPLGELDDAKREMLYETLEKAGLLERAV